MSKRIGTTFPSPGKDYLYIDPRWPPRTLRDAARFRPRARIAPIRTARSPYGCSSPTRFRPLTRIAPIRTPDYPNGWESRHMFQSPYEDYPYSDGRHIIRWILARQVSVPSRGLPLFGRFRTRAVPRARWNGFS